MKDSYFLNSAIRLPVLDWKISFFGAHRQKVSAGWSVPPEKHLAFEILYIIQGEEHIIIKNKHFIAKPKDIIIIPPGFKHEVLPVTNTVLEYFCAHFDIDDANFINNMIRHCDIFIENDTDFNNILTDSIGKWLDIITNKTDYNFNTKMSIQIILSELLIKLNTYAVNQNILDTHTSLDSANYAKEIAETIKNRFKENVLSTSIKKDIKIEDVIESIGLSSGYGYQIFKQVYGFSPREYLSKLTINEAKTLLMKPDLSIEEISRKLNYKNTAHFSRQFKRWSGVSPTLYRKSEIIYNTTS